MVKIETLVIKNLRIAKLEGDRTQKARKPDGQTGRTPGKPKAKAKPTLSKDKNSFFSLLPAVRLSGTPLPILGIAN